MHQFNALLFIPPNTLMHRDVATLLRLKKRIVAATKKTGEIEPLMNKWQQLLAEAKDRVEQRARAVPVVSYPAELPVSQQQNTLLSAIKNNQVLIVAGETGSGKTTQLPKMCLSLGFGVRGCIGHTQPRRLAATSIATRIAEELGCSLGQEVGYQIRFNTKRNDSTLISVMTDGILLNQIKHDPLLLAYDVLILDEAHERNINIDFLLGYLKKILVKRKDLKVIITSATINVEKFSSHFSNAPVVTVSGRNYPIETIYLESDPSRKENDLSAQIVEALKYIEQLEKNKSHHTSGNVLVFLPTERDIKDAEKQLKEAGYTKEAILPLYARLPRHEQQRIFLTKGQANKIILATNIAETSITVPGVRYVIDSGLVRLSRYNYRSKIQQLPIEWVSKASADQRRGRCGREGAGTCIRLYSEQQYQLMMDETEPEILRSNLATVILRSIDLGVNSLEEFPFIDKVDPRLINDGFKLLHELQALDDNQHLTDVGRQLSHLPIDPRLGRMLIAAKRLGCLPEVLIIVSCLAIQDPREFPPDKQVQAKQAHARFQKNVISDFWSILLLWQYIQQQKKELSSNAFKRLCQKEYLNFLRLREWQSLVKQLAEQFKLAESKLLLTHHDSPEIIHRALLAGLLGHLGLHKEKNLYQGARNKFFHLLPGSSLISKSSPWIIAAELVETSKLYGRVCAPVDPSWVMDYASKLVKHQYHEPHWSKKHGQAMVWQTTLLYGLPVIDRQRVSLFPLDPALSHEWMVRHLFVEEKLDEYLTNTPPFWEQHQAIKEKIHKLEAKTRRHDLLIDELTLLQRYQNAIPPSVYSIKTLQHWLSSASKQALEKLNWNESDLLQQCPAHISEAQFPNTLVHNGYTFKLEYHFHMGAVDDGVTVVIPLDKLAYCHPEAFEWLVPGLLHEKTTALLKTLPKNIRKRLLPIGDAAHRVLQNSTVGNGSLLIYLKQALQKHYNLTVSRDDFNLEKLDPYYLMNFKITEPENGLLGQGRDLNALKRKLTPLLEQQMNRPKPEIANGIKPIVYQTWAFNTLEDVFQESGLLEKNSGFPALFCEDEGCVVKLMADKSKAKHSTIEAVVRFFMQEMRSEIKYMRKELLKDKSGGLRIAAEADGNNLLEQLIENVIYSTFLHNGLPADKADFLKKLADYRAQLMPTGQRYFLALVHVLQLKQEVRLQLEQVHNSHINVYNDCNTQLEQLFPKNFIIIAKHHLLDYPRYLQAMKARFHKLPGNEARDLNLMMEAQVHEQRLWEYLEYDVLPLLYIPALQRYRFLLEEFRISLFDQTQKTREKVSAKRLQKCWLEIME